ncbi:LPS assembly protein LptD [uncultured Shimia sp.]|uniref:LPS-assembly protein LptD n=1 Tax=uncultured Shimia sp. TaxID=573152 RepID=UPI0026315B83|nr:LPS assembly protein LptD [uncultured Shimia sp.]
MTTVLRNLVFCMVAVLLALPAFAQAPPSGNVVLIADRVYLTGEDVLIAEGHVEAVQGDVRLRASRIQYNRTTDLVTVSGPIHLQQGSEMRIVATYAELDPEFRNAILYSARVVLSDQVQMTSTKMRRIEGRYDVLDKTLVTSCRVCSDGSPPLWQIRASRVVHDEEERQLYFDHAQFRVLDVPVLYFPQLRMPDPTMRRATGFLIPTLHQSSLLGFGARIPYFKTFGQHKDLLIRPFLAQNTTTLELRYRQAFRNGRMTWEGAISDDTLGYDQPRHFVFGEGKFNLKRDWKLSFNVKAVSDDAYLFDYDYSDEDRLNSDITLRRSRRDENTRIALLHYQSLRDAEEDNTIPSIVGVAETERRYFPSAIGGEARVNLQLHSHYRDSSFDMDGPDDDTETDGRDMTRVTAAASWRRNWTHDNGLRSGVTGEIAFDGFHTKDDAIYEGSVWQVTPTVATHLRYPMTRIEEDGTTQVLEPLAQLSYSGGNTLDIANDESTRVEFDEGNLLALSRFPSTDRRERGLVAAVGVNWARYDVDGWRTNLSFGQVYQQDPHPDFTNSSGLSGSASDFLMAGQISNDKGLSFMARGLLNDLDGLNKASARATWTNDTLWLDASFIWLRADARENRAENLSEWVIDTRYRMSRHWTALADWRYDVQAGQSAKAGIGVEYRNECVKIGFSVSRSFVTTTNLEPRTDIGLTLALMGFSVTAKDKSYHRTCG